jgi:hypothetical protein
MRVGGGLEYSIIRGCGEPPQNSRKLADAKLCKLSKELYAISRENNNLPLPDIPYKIKNLNVEKLIIHFFQWVAMLQNTIVGFIVCAFL